MPRVTGLRHKSVKLAIEAGMNIYCENRPDSIRRRRWIYTIWHKMPASSTGVVQDKLYGYRNCETEETDRFWLFGRILSVRGEFGYWVFEAIPSKHNGPPGITAKKMAEVSSWTCFAIGGTCWIMSLDR